MITLACMDMAGTTVRDGGLVESAFRAAISGSGITPDQMPAALAHIHRTMGMPKQVVFRDLFDGDDEAARRAVKRFDEAVLAEIEGGSVSAIEGATACFERLRAGRVAICLTTGFTREVQQALVAALGWEELVDLVLCPSAELRGRPFPDLVLAAALHFQVDDVRDVAVVGDTSNDLVSGRRAGAGLLAGVLTGAHGREELEAVTAARVIDSVAVFPALIGRD